MHFQRLIGKLSGDKKGAFFVCIGGMHGNELAGVRAIEIFIRVLEKAMIEIPNFTLNGSIAGFCGNLQGLRSGSRYIWQDMNRLWEADRIVKIEKSALADLEAEEQEIKSLILAIRKEVQELKPEKIVVLDLHTTSAEGGVFCIPTPDPDSLRIAESLQAPVINGMLDGIEGTSLQYFGAQPFEGAQTIAVGFEAGQHKDKLSVSRAITAICHAISHLQILDDSQIDFLFAEMLADPHLDSPLHARLKYRHPIFADDHFAMLPGFRNFDRIHKGQELARDIYGPILSEMDGYILMPLYQAQG
ncbi:MAG: succinylglutamate desuccinylase/aspartoacylase family protein, partial [Saprospiraceae bacterium]